jgi:hypothetical protein
MDTAGEPARPFWWVVDADNNVVAGPFAERADTLHAVDAITDMREVYGVGRPDGTLDEHPSPVDRAWEAYLSAQLDRLCGGHDLPPVEHIRQQVVTRAVATALVEAGFSIHDCAGRSADTAIGGVCLTPSADAGPDNEAGVIVSWTQHDRMAVEHRRGLQVHQVIQDVMNDALCTVLVELGFAVRPIGSRDIPFVLADQDG